jgi:hypothetical protein
LSIEIIKNIWHNFSRNTNLTKVTSYTIQLKREVGWDLGYLYISTRIWWVKWPTWKLILSLQLWSWYHQGIDSAMTHVPRLSVKVSKKIISK